MTSELKHSQYRKTSVTLELALMRRARTKAQKNGQSLSSYINVLIRKDQANANKP